MKSKGESAGMLALRRCGKSQSEIARLCGVSAQTVHRWWHGIKPPAAEHRARLEALKLVLASQWDQASRGRGAAPAPKETVPVSPPTASGPVDTRELLAAQVDRLRVRLDDKTLTNSAAVQVERALGQALAAISKLDGADITEATILRTPAFRRVMATLTTVRVEALQSGASAAELVRMEAEALSRLVGG